MNTKEVMTVGDLRRALKRFNDSDTVAFNMEVGDNGKVYMKRVTAISASCVRTDDEDKCELFAMLS